MNISVIAQNPHMSYLTIIIIQISINSQKVTELPTCYAIT